MHEIWNMGKTVGRKKQSRSFYRSVGQVRPNRAAGRPKYASAEPH